ncbi:hypothetical protein [uncultured Thiodictyon sp.]|uniref:hypothetical protein n=1 Tax=uncultured Thiodictyon sp. TaxID=1846217 RepID=UPI0025D819F4|nr:hypothetical protein [uncultured Thiodictyon sp.]
MAKRLTVRLQDTLAIKVPILVSAAGLLWIAVFRWWLRLMVLCCGRLTENTTGVPIPASRIAKRRLLVGSWQDSQMAIEFVPILGHTAVLALVIAFGALMVEM